MNPLLSYPRYLREAYVLRLMLEPIVGRNRTMFCVADNPEDPSHPFWASIIVQSPQGNVSVIPVAPVEDACEASARWRNFLHSTDRIEDWAEIIRMSPLANREDRASIITTLVRDGYLDFPISWALFGVQPMVVS